MTQGRKVLFSAGGLQKIDYQYSFHPLTQRLSRINVQGTPSDFLLVISIWQIQPEVKCQETECSLVLWFGFTWIGIQMRYEEISTHYMALEYETDVWNVGSRVPDQF